MPSSDPAEATDASSTSRAPARGGFARRAALVVGAATALQLGLAELWIGAMPTDLPIAGGHTLTVLVAIAAGVLALGALYARGQDGPGHHAAAAVPRTRLAISAVAGAIGLLLAEAGPGLAELHWTTLGWPWALLFSAALAASTIERAALRALAVRSIDARGPAAELPAPPRGTLRLAGLFGIACLASITIAFALLSAHPDTVELPPAMLGYAAAVCGLAAAAGWALGHAPMADVVSVTRHFERIANDPNATIDDRLVALRADQMGLLLTNLELLRAQLVAERRQYEEALERTKLAESLKSEFLSAVSHELRTPLGAVSGFAQLLLEPRPHPLTDAQAEDVRLIQTGSKQLLDLINDILDIAMIESGELRLSFAPCDIGEVIVEVVRIHQSLVRDREIELHAELGPELPMVVCDRRRLTQILTNLVSNAVKFTERGHITVRAALDPLAEVVVIRCIDTGLGIAAEELDTIFEEYRQAGSLAIRRRKKGTGLGLAIARTIAEYHGGSLSVESRVGEGSTFTLRLPLRPPGPPASIDVHEQAARSKLRPPALAAGGRSP